MDDIEAVGALQDPVRRRLYDFVCRHRGDVGRNEAAEAVGVQRTLAAFHLDRLVEVGLLEAVFRRISGRTGPGAGRPAKLYRPSAAEYEVSLPPRDYQTAALVLAEVAEELRLEAAVGRAARRLGGSQAARAPAGVQVVSVLKSRGYEPVTEDGGAIGLRNCPFRLLAESFPPLVCGMNLALLEGLLDGLDAPYTACMEPRPGWCCVAIRPSKNNED